MRLGLHLDPFYRFYKQFKATEMHPSLAASISQLAGIDMVLASLSTNSNEVMAENDFLHLFQMISTDICILIPQEPIYVDLVKKLNPHSVIITESNKHNPTEPYPVNVEDSMDILLMMIKEIQEASISVAVLTEANVNNARKLSKLRANGIIMDTNSYAEARFDNSAQAQIEILSETAFTANKLGMYVGCFGGLNFQNVQHLGSIKFIEEIYMGSSILSRAVLKGLKTTIRDAVELLNRQVVQN